MNIFGFEVIGIQTITVKCPKGDHTATILFYPSKENTPIPVQKEVKDAFRELGISDILSIPNCDDLHFLCIKCLITLKKCEQLKDECKIERKDSP